MSAALALPVAHPRPGNDFADRPRLPAPSGASPRRRADEVHFRVVYWLTFPIFMVASLARRVRPGQRPNPTGPRLSRPSVFREARAAAQTCGSLSLMG
ncbi:hypothetical protein [uncultured Enterovirga sp.]|uniref:hypothetical protein n=1 Tax=uncultured Enterovirga sp. TaxID=2026352 RepID=UPI0035CA2E4E